MFWVGGIERGTDDLVQRLVVGFDASCMYAVALLCLGLDLVFRDLESELELERGEMACRSYFTRSSRGKGGSCVRVK